MGKQNMVKHGKNGRETNMNRPLKLNLKFETLGDIQYHSRNLSNDA